MAAAQIPLAEQLQNVPTNVRPTVKAAIKTVKEVAPNAHEITYRSGPPRSSSAMWKLVRYSVGAANLVGVATFTNHSTLFLYRGRELADKGGRLQGTGKGSRYVTLRGPADAGQPAVKRLVRQAFQLAGGGKN